MVEAALVVSLFLIPMLVGVLTLGERLWHAQKVGPYEPRIASSQIVGVFDCTQIVDRVQSTVADNIAGLGVPVDPSWVSARVIDAAPGAGVLVDVSVTVPPPDGTGDPVTTGAAIQLDNAGLTASVCG